jgi:protein-disulfide isomerase
MTAPSAAFAEISAQAARSCGVTQAVVDASQAARPVLATFERDAAFADRGAGPIRIIEFADYSCPACRALHPRWIAFARANPDVRISVVEYPIYGRTLVSRATSNRTLNASRIAIAAAAQGKQLAFHDALMTIPGRVDDRAIRQAAERAGLDFAAVTRLAQTPAVAARADANLRLAERLGFVGTPHVVVDGVLLSLQRGWTLQQVDCLVRASRSHR